MKIKVGLIKEIKDMSREERIINWFGKLWIWMKTKNQIFPNSEYDSRISFILLY